MLQQPLTDEHLSVAAYYSIAEETDRFRDNPDDLMYLGFGLFGEVGGLLAASKKVSRDTLLETESQVAAEELGDALWYLISLANHAGVMPESLGIRCLEILEEQQESTISYSIEAITFEEIDRLSKARERHEDRRALLLCRLAEQTGSLTGVLANLRTDGANSSRSRLAGVLATLAIVTGQFGLSLADVARQNIIKIQDRWPPRNTPYTPHFDAEYEVLERLPRQFEITFISRSVADREIVIQQLCTVNIGDPLTDNRHVPDGYRFHDVFHLAYVAHLGWSPVIRALLKLKRKSNPKIDENEDGARAVIIEEGIATWIFNHAAKRNFYEGLERGRLEYSLLKQIRRLVSGYEIDRCPLWQWELAILEGFAAFRALLANHGGRVAVDMDLHKITYIST